MTEQNFETELNDLLTWSNETKLVFNSAKKKTKISMIDDKVINIC